MNRLRIHLACIALLAGACARVVDPADAGTYRSMYLMFCSDTLRIEESGRVEYSTGCCMGQDVLATGTCTVSDGHLNLSWDSMPEHWGPEMLRGEFETDVGGPSLVLGSRTFERLGGDAAK